MTWPGGWADGRLALPFAYGGARCRGLIRSRPEDFQVDEVSLVEPDGSGEHVLLQIEKRNSNTDWVAGLLARHASVPRRDVSYAGMKDRHALTRQWFSVRLAGRPEPDWDTLGFPELRVLQARRHSRKLRRGALRGNRFTLCVRDLQGDRESIGQTLGEIGGRGVPNYFGEQRFGRGGSNLAAAQTLFQGGCSRPTRGKLGIYLSAARAALFNQVLACRVAAGNWNHPLDGERLILDGSRNSFSSERIDRELVRRVREMEIHPSGPLWGTQDAGVHAEVSRLEQEWLEPLALYRDGLERFGLKQERRALRARVSDLSWSFEGGRLEIGFFLCKGSYATAVLRELVDYAPGGAG